jgi:hypothetical protein
MKLEQTAGLCNIRLRDAGVNDRWTYDDDRTSNSVGSWFCENVGGVTTAKQIREYTDQIIARARARREF